MTKRIAVLLSGRGSNFQSLLNTSLQGLLGGEISLVISNRPGAGGLKIAQEAGIENQSILRKLTHNEIIYEIYDVDDVIDFFTKVQSGQVEVEYTTDDFINKTTTVTLISKETLEELGYNDIYLQLGVGPMMKSDLLYSISYPFVSIYENFSNIFTTIRLLFSPNQGVDASDLSGPIGIFSLISRASSEGVIELISFTASLIQELRWIDMADFWSRYKRNRMAVIGLFIIVLILIMAATASLFYPDDPFRLVGKPLSGPLENGFLLGSDSLGRDVASGIVHGAKTSLLIGLIATLVSIFIGIFFGAFAGYYGGRLDDFLMRVTEIFQTIPSFVFAILLVAIMKPSISSIVIAIAVVSWPGV
ncbi:MAG: ABC transporter permease subunit, partial [Gammaproteobacteria bacterium]|nr:ABC transporter permease subunit [Gammaproteobacteria bacterium]